MQEPAKIETQPPATRTRSWKSAGWGCVLIVLLTFVAYLPALRSGFIWDDDAHITRAELRSWHGLARIWFDVGATQQYYPLLHTVFWVEHKFFGVTPLGYHLVNIGLHALNVVLLLLVLRTLQMPGRYLAAAVFALHPVMVESVAWISELKNTLSALFYLAAALAYLRFDRMRDWRAYGLGLALFVIALLTKTVTATLPAALLLVFWWQRGKLSWKRDVQPLIPLFLLGAAAGCGTAWVERKLIGAGGAEFDFTLVERCLIAGRVVWFYLGKLLWPAELLFHYPRWNVSQGIWWQYLYPVGLVLAMVLAWGIRHRSRAPLAALLFFAGTLFPVLGFLDVYPFRYSLVADHFQYLASLGVIVLASAGVMMGLEHLGFWGRLGRYLLCAALVGTLGTLTWRQSRMYTDIETLYRNTIQKNPDCWVAQNNLGNVLAMHGRHEEAIEHYRQTLRLKPDLAIAHNNLGVALAELGRTAEAIEHYQEALRLIPVFARAHYNWGNVLAAQGQMAEAFVHYREAVRLKPDFAEAHNNLGVALANQGHTAEAIEHYQEALRLNPVFARAHYNWGNVLAPQGHMAEAIVHYREAVRLKPDDIPMLSKLAWVLATNPDDGTRDGAGAVRLAGRACELTGHNDPGPLDVLAAAYAEAGRFNEAVKTAEQAAQLARARSDQRSATEIEARLQLYREGRPYRQDVMSQSH